MREALAVGEIRAPHAEKGYVDARIGRRERQAIGRAHRNAVPADRRCVECVQVEKRCNGRLPIGHHGIDPRVFLPHGEELRLHGRPRKRSGPAGAVDRPVDGSRREAVVADKTAGEVDDSGMGLVLRAAVAQQHERAPRGRARGRPQHDGNPPALGFYLEFLHQHWLAPFSCERSK
ncbi:MAG: hypothetical protein FJX56_11560, partial [Alphaproteobacteria bacterium]|nr:hypothetical protein [Alphaproteobacteria bacterium]